MMPINEILIELISNSNRILDQIDKYGTIIDKDRDMIIEYMRRINYFNEELKKFRNKYLMDKKM